MNYKGNLAWVDVQKTAQRILEHIKPTFPDAHIREYTDMYFVKHIDIRTSSALGSDFIYLNVAKRDGVNVYTFGVVMSDIHNEHFVMQKLVDTCFVYKEPPPPPPPKGLSLLIGDKAKPKPVLDNED